MRAISLWQQWATAVALRSKRIETRHWSTDYRGPLAIHAAKRFVRSELIGFRAHWSWTGAMRGAGWSFGNNAAPVDALPFGAIVAVCDLADCRPTDSFTQAELDTPEQHPDDIAGLYKWTPRQMGNFALGRFGWTLENIRPLTTPLPFKGGQSFFQVLDDLLAPLLPKEEASQ